jgi:hypothetical protein
MRFQVFQNGIRAFNRFDAPGERQHIAPIAVGTKQRFEQNVIGLRKGPSNCASQFSAAAAADSVSIRAPRVSKCLNYTD